MRPMKIAAFALTLALAYAAVLVGVALFQQRLLYFPVKAPVESMAVQGLRAWPSAQDFRGLVAEPAGAARGTAIVFHGNAGHAGDRVAYAQALTRLGLRVILAEYPGYGPREGSPGEKVLVDDAAQSIGLAQRNQGGPVLVIGESLGAGVAAAAAGRRPADVAGLLLITPWDRLVHVAGHHYSWLPTSWLLRDRYDSVSNLAAFGRPVMVVVAERDATVPPQFGRALFEGLAQPKRLVLVPEAQHNDWLARVDEVWWREAIAFAMK
jgi:hypothetical protein